MYLCLWWTRLMCDWVALLFLKECIPLSHLCSCRKLQNPFSFFISDYKIITSILVPTIFCSNSYMWIRILCYINTFLLPKLVSNTDKTITEIIFLVIIWTTIQVINSCDWHNNTLNQHLINSNYLQLMVLLSKTLSIHCSTNKIPSCAKPFPIQNKLYSAAFLLTITHNISLLTFTNAIAEKLRLKRKCWKTYCQLVS